MKPWLPTALVTALATLGFTAGAARAQERIRPPTVQPVPPIGTLPPVRPVPPIGNLPPVWPTPPLETFPPVWPVPPIETVPPVWAVPPIGFVPGPVVVTPGWSWGWGWGARPYGKPRQVRRVIRRGW